MRRHHPMPFGAELLATGGTRFRFWAPDIAQATLVIEDRSEHAMQALFGGWHELLLDIAGAGTHYRFQLDDGTRVPDPASRFNPLDVEGPSEVIDANAYDWHDADWPGRPWHEAVVYELHVGTFTTAGTFAAAAARLADLVSLGITAIELMPVADFPGRRGWGYDGVLLFAPEASYGRPDDLKALVDHAHALGLMVLLDVVYNHFGPSGNHLHAYSAAFFNPAHPTPWGAAINFDDPANTTVRDFFVHNALLWIHEYHFDGLRLDAVHAICDESEIDIVHEIGMALRDPRHGRHIHLVLENHHNDPYRLRQGIQPAGSIADALEAGLADAQWNDDLHHAAHVVLTGETDSYYEDFATASLQQLARALAEGFVFQGQASAHMQGRRRGHPSGHLVSSRFVSFLQNHDQIGNRAFGQRLDRLADPALLEAMYACLLLSPHIPMLFMGEEFAASTPFLYFCDFGPELAEAVRSGREREFALAEAFADPALRERIPDPNAASTFGACKLHWNEREHEPHASRLALITRLLALRRRWLLPLLPAQSSGGQWQIDGSVISVDWPFDGQGVMWQLRANVGNAPVTMTQPEGDVVYTAHAATEAGSLTLSRGGVWVACRQPQDRHE